MVGRKYRQGEGKNNIGNVEAKNLLCMTHGHTLKGGNVGGAVYKEEGSEGEEMGQM